ncbi:MAG: 3-hydroxyacyl-CoA dehydrogenase family protein [Bacteroidia bacterium]|nr:3-hydroxyacyl-CoA dehydrogenase family protein [Bacteroidia bacterium]MDW8133861.1 3-hydroxyacyl-CoA dehydrogenase family protein [Bacteroidia bacterium]
MRALVIGSPNRLEALMQGVGNRWNAELYPWPSQVQPDWNLYEVIVDLEADERPSPAFEVTSEGLWVLSSVKKPLRRQLPSQEWRYRCVGVNLLPGFCEREMVEGTALSKEAWERFIAWEPKAIQVPDEVGMISARILCLIINEAFLLQGEAHLPMETLDTAVKLGLNYPHSLTEWGEKIGWKHIREIVEALQEEYGAGVYPVAPNLRFLG